MPKVEKDLWGRSFQLGISYDCLDDEEVLPSQEEALDTLFENWSGVEESLYLAKQQCAKDSAGQLKVADINDVFDYITPQSLFVVRKPSNTVALMCNYEFDLEHGLAIVFEGGKAKEIGPQDIVL